MENLIDLRVKKNYSDANIPQKSHSSDEGYDVFAYGDPVVQKNNNGDILYIEYDCGISVAPPEGYYVEVFPRSSISKTSLVLCNSIGLIDNGYRGPIKLRFKYIGSLFDNNNIYKSGDRIGQIVIRKSVLSKITETESLDDTERSTGGFGSTGK